MIARRIIGVLVMSAVMSTLASCVRSPQEGFFLVAGDGARWIRHDDDFLVAGRGGSNESTLFRTQVSLQMAVPTLPLKVKGFRACAVFVDNSLVKELVCVDRVHLDESTVQLPPLGSGVHDLIFVVGNRSAHPALLASCGDLGLHTGTGRWESSKDGRVWTPAIALEDSRSLDPYPSDWTTAAAVGRTWPWLILASLIGAAFAWLRRAPSEEDVRRLRFALLIAWVVVSINDMVKIPLNTGMDVPAHMEYIRAVAREWRPPLANEGWERLQPPLFYFLSAVVSLPLRLFGPEHFERSLRVLTMLCGVAQIELAYRYARLIFSSKPLHQLVVIACVACIPMNFYMSQVVGNEPLAGVLVAATIYFALRMMAADTQQLTQRNALLLGVTLGLACLTKVSAVSLFPFMLALAAFKALRLEGGMRERLRVPGLVLGSTLAIAGWFYVRNWVCLGSPFIGGWSWKEMNQEWWQDPSFRIPSHVYRFGEALVHPIYATTHGLMDTLYSTFWLDGSFSGSTRPPPWNYDAALTMVWIGLPLTLVLVLGCVIPLDKKNATFRGVLVGAFVSVGAAIVAVYIQFPVYSAAKASYALGLVPTFGCLMAWGFSPMLASTWGRAVVGGLLAAALAFTFAAYCVVN